MAPRPTDHDHRALPAAARRRRDEEGHAAVDSPWPTVAVLAAVLVLVALLEWAAGADVRGWLRDRIAAGA